MNRPGVTNTAAASNGNIAFFIISTEFLTTSSPSCQPNSCDCALTSVLLPLDAVVPAMLHLDTDVLLFPARPGLMWALTCIFSGRYVVKALNGCDMVGMRWDCTIGDDILARCSFHQNFVTQITLRCLCQDPNLSKRNWDGCFAIKICLELNYQCDGFGLMNIFAK